MHQTLKPQSTVPLWLIMIVLFCAPARTAVPACLQATSPPTLQYTLTVRDTDTPRTTSNTRNSQIHVSVTASPLPQTSLEFAIPAWTPGYYQILHYETGIHNVRAQEPKDGRELPVAHPSERVWRVDTSSLTSGANSLPIVTLSYDVDARDDGLGFFGTSLDMRNQQGYVNGASALMYPVGQTQSPCELTVRTPQTWHIATPMEPETAEIQPLQDDAQSPDHLLFQSKRFHARTYDEMIDCPVQLGKFETIDFNTDGVAFQCIIAGRPIAGAAGVRDALQKIAHSAIELFGNAPFPRYQFIYHIGGGGFLGGLEHHNSTVIHLALGLGSGKNEDFLTTSAHELFHAWNVKRLRPDGLGPFDYTQPVRTGSLWFAEGVTDYFAQLLLVRSGLQTREWFWRDMTNRIQQLDHTPARVRVSLQQASSHAWEGESEGYDGLSYYLKGSLVGLYFDLRLHALTHNQAGLDDVMRWLDAHYGTRSLAYPEEALLAAINAIAQQDLQPEYMKLVQGFDEIDWDSVLRAAGLQLLRDTGPFLGVRIADTRERENGQSGVLVQSVEAGHAAARMGLQVGDRLLRVEDRAVSRENFSDVVHTLPAHGVVSLQILRGDQTLRLVGEAGGVYEHHQLVRLPISQFSPREQVEARSLQQSMFMPSPPLRPTTGVAKQETAAP